MANQRIDALTVVNTHGCGVVNTSWARHLTNGQKLTLGNLDNYTLAETVGFDTDGNATCKALSAITVKGLLVTTVEEEALYGEGDLQGNYNDFYNAMGDMVRLTIQEQYLRFEVTNFTKNAGLATIALGNVAHYDTTTKAFIVSAVGTEHVGYATAVNKYDVVGADTDFGFNIGTPTIRLQCK